MLALDQLMVETLTVVFLRMVLAGCHGARQWNASGAGSQLSGTPGVAVLFGLAVSSADHWDCCLARPLPGDLAIGSLANSCRCWQQRASM